MADPHQDIEPATIEGNESDEGFVDDYGSSTQSVASSIYDYELSQGRTYHAYHSGKYMMPNDEAELDRVDIAYHAIRLSIGNKHFHAPIPSPSSVLDVGTGTGIWAIDVGDAHPEAEVVGIDLSPTQPTLVPPNVRFEIADADEEWTFRPESFDLIHTRAMNDLTLKDWADYYRQAFRALKPGGWVEAQECRCRRSSDDGTIPADGHMLYWEDQWEQAMRMIGKNGHCDPDLVLQQMRAAGFVNITIKNFKVPIGTWPKDRDLKDAGRFALVMMIEGMHGMSVKLFTSVLGWEVDKFEALVAKSRAELKRKDIHSYFQM
jgi:SAM-dependent methyltransferase